MKLAAIALLAAASYAQLTLQGNAFAPFASWKAAVETSDRAALARLYSRQAAPAIGKTAVPLADELSYWAGLRAAGVTNINPKILEMSVGGDTVSMVLRVEAMKSGQKVVCSFRQHWAQEGGVWQLTATRRSDFSVADARRLPEPSVPNTALYPEPGQAPAELQAAMGEAARAHKRVLVVFGANWCYDCQVLNTTFHSKAFAPLVDGNYVVVHVNVGDEGKDNADLAARLGVALDKGIPSLAVMEANGKVLVAQKNGEFESTVKIGPEEVHAFLEQWKP